MKISTLAIIAVGTLAASSVLAGGEDFQQNAAVNSGSVYINVNGGAAFSPSFNHESSLVKYDTGYVVDGAVGYAFRNNVRVEANLGYLSNQVQNTGVFDVNIGAFTAMANAYYDIPTGMIFPYVGAGLGYANLTASVSAFGDTVSRDSNVFAYQGIAGIGAHVSQHITLDVQYRRLETTANDNTTQYSNNLVEAGLSYAF